MKNNTATPKIIKEVSFMDLSLEGVKGLKALAITTTFEVVQDFDSETNQLENFISKKLIGKEFERICFPLTEVTCRELTNFRKSGISFFVLKMDNKLFYSKIPENLYLTSSKLLGTHRCATIGQECNRLSAASDEQKGCAKVREYSQCIEKYPWIKTGYETFGTKNDSFVVAKCLHYEKCSSLGNYYILKK